MVNLFFSIIRRRCMEEEKTGTCTMARYLDPTNDVAFKKLFGSEGHESLLISFLNAILELKGDEEIKKIQLLPKDQAPMIKEAKTTILDVKCTDAIGNQYIVEMQNKKVPAFVKRVQLYAAHSYLSQFSAGEDYVSLKPVILLCIANHILFTNKSRTVSYHQTLDKHTNDHDLQDLSYVFIELPKFDKKEKDLITVQDKWIYFFKNWDHSLEIPSSVSEKELIEAYRSMEEFNWTKGELEAYLKARIALTDEFVARQTERAEGKAEGIAEGIEKGKAEGEAKKVREMALKLIQRGLSLEEIAEDT